MRRELVEYQVLLARTQTVHRPIGPLAFDCVKVIIVRDGSAILFSEFGQKPVTVGDVVVLGPDSGGLRNAPSSSNTSSTRANTSCSTPPAAWRLSDEFPRIRSEI